MEPFIVVFLTTFCGSLFVTNIAISVVEQIEIETPYFVVRPVMEECWAILELDEVSFWTVSKIESNILVSSGKMDPRTLLLGIPLKTGLYFVPLQMLLSMIKLIAPTNSICFKFLEKSSIWNFINRFSEVNK